MSAYASSVPQDWTAQPYFRLHQARICALLWASLLTLVEVDSIDLVLQGRKRPLLWRRAAQAAHRAGLGATDPSITTHPLCYYSRFYVVDYILLPRLLLKSLRAWCPFSPPSLNWCVPAKCVESACMSPSKCRRAESFLPDPRT